MEDRLIEFQRLSGVSSVVPIPVPQEGEESREFLPHFSARTKLLQQAINQVHYNSKTILKLKDKHKEATLNEKEKEISEEITKLIDQSNVISKTVADQLATMKDDVEQSQKNEPDEPETRMKNISHAALSNKFSEMLKESQAAQLEFKTAVKDKLARQAKIYDNSLSPEELDNIVNDPEGMAKLISSKMIGGVNNKMQNAVSDLQDKYRDILKLEQSVEVLHQMFVDMAMLVHANGALIDSIELNVCDARDYVEKAVKRLDDGKEAHKSGNKWQLVGLICCLILGAIIAFFVL